MKNSVPDPRPKQIGRYHLDRLLAVGGMGAVYLAHTEGLAGFSKRLVVKCILQEHLQHREAVELFFNEARLAALLEHPNIVQTFDFGEDGGTYYLAMEYVDGLSLRALERRLAQEGRALPAPIAAHIMAQALHGLHHAHTFADEVGRPRPILHRDVSPENILIAAGGHVKLADFGIARMLGPESALTGVFRGKLLYAAPERVALAAPQPGSDVYSAGVVLYEALSGRAPVAGSGVRTDASFVVLGAVAPLVPQELIAIVHRALAFEPRERFSDAAAMAHALERFCVSAASLVTPTDLASFVRSLSADPAKDGPLQLARGETAPAAPQDLRGTDVELPETASQEAPPSGEQGRSTTARRARARWVAVAASASLIIGGGIVLARALNTQEPTADASPPETGGEQPEAEIAVRTPARGPPSDAPPPPARTEPNSGAGPQRARARNEEARGSDRRERRSKLELRIHPWAEVRLNGEPIGTSPLPILEIAPGRHVIELANREFGLRRPVSVTIRPGQDVRISVNLLTGKTSFEAIARSPQR